MLWQYHTHQSKIRCQCSGTCLPVLTITTSRLTPHYCRSPFLPQPLIYTPCYTPLVTPLFVRCKQVMKSSVVDRSGSTRVVIIGAPADVHLATQMVPPHPPILLLLLLSPSYPPHSIFLTLSPYCVNSTSTYCNPNNNLSRR